MAYKIPNYSDATYSEQAEPDSVDFDILAAGHAIYGVKTGCAVSAQGTPDMTVAVAVGTVYIGGRPVAVTAGNVTITTADGSNPRIDLITVDTAGTKAAVAGTPSSNPVCPAIPASKTALAAVYVPSGVTAITSGMITDKRIFCRQLDRRFNVLDYGAVGDGTTDDTVAVAAAAAAAAVAFSCAYIPSGYTFKLTDTVTANAVGAGFVGDGYGSIIDFLPATLTKDCLVVGNASALTEGLLVKDIQIRSQAQVTGAGLKILNANSSNFENVWIRHGGTSAKVFRYGVYYDGGGKNDFRHIDIRGVEATNGVGLYRGSTLAPPAGESGCGHTFTSLYISHADPAVTWYPKAGIQIDNMDGGHFIGGEIMMTGTALLADNPVSFANSSFEGLIFDNRTPTNGIPNIALVYLHAGAATTALVGIDFAECLFALNTYSGSEFLKILADSTGSINTITCTNCQFSVAVGTAGVEIQKTSTGTVTNIRFASCNFRSTYAAHEILVGDGVGSFYVSDSYFGDHGGGATDAINFAAGTTAIDYNITDCQFVGVCEGITDNNTGAGTKVKRGNSPVTVNDLVVRSRYIAAYDTKSISGAADNSIGSTPNQLYFKLFSPSSSDQVIYNFGIPSTYSTSANAYIDWTPPDAGTGSAVWELYYASIATGANTTAAGIGLTAISSACGTAFALQRATLGTGLSVTAGQLYKMSIRRLGAATADTYTSSANFSGFELKWSEAQ